MGQKLLILKWYKANDFYDKRKNKNKDDSNNSQNNHNSNSNKYNSSNEYSSNDQIPDNIKQLLILMKYDIKIAKNRKRNKI